MNSGLWVTFAGIDGAGKDTLAGMSARLLSDRDIEAGSLTKRAKPDNAGARRYLGMLSDAAFPGNPQELVTVLRPERWLIQATLWYGAFYDEVVNPMRASKPVTLLNSWYHKHYARYGLKNCPAAALEFMTSHLPEAGLTFFLDVKPEVAVERRATFTVVECGGFDGYEPNREGFIAYQSRIYESLNKLADTKGWRRIELAPAEDMADSIADQIAQHLETYYEPDTGGRVSQGSDQDVPATSRPGS